MQCGAKTRDGTPCRAHAMENGRCRMHGGKVPRGAALPQTKHGRYSKDLPTRLAERFTESEADPELLNLKAEIALTDARIEELVQRLSRGESGEQWDAVKLIHSAMNQAIDEDELDAMSPLVDRLGAVIAEHRADERTWSAISTQQEIRRRLVDTEGKRRVAMQQLIGADKAMLLVSALSDTVRRHVHDRAVLAAIAAEFRAIAEHPDR